MDDGSQLKSLDLAGSGVSSVDWASLSPELLAQVLVSLEGGRFDLETGIDGQKYQLIVRASNEWSMYSLTPDHVTSLFSKISDSSVMNMKDLQLAYCEIPHIPPELLSQALTKLETFEAQMSDNLTAAQISAVFTSLSVEKDLKLKALDLSLNDLSSVPTETLVAGISGLEWVNLFQTELTTEQLTGIFTGLSVEKDHKLKTIDLGFNDLSSVPTDLLVAGISGLQEVYLSWTNLTTEQVTGIDRAELNQSVRILL